MKLLAYALAGVVLAAIVVLMGYHWAHHTYAVGVEVNWTAITLAVIAVAVSLIVASALLSARSTRDKQ